MLGRHLEVFLTKQFWASCCLTRTSTSHSVVPCGILLVLWYRGIMVCCGILWVLWYTVVFSGYLESRVRLLSSLSIRGACVASHSSSSLLKYTKTSTKTKTQKQARKLKHKRQAQRGTQIETQRSTKQHATLWARLAAAHF